MSSARILRYKMAEKTLWQEFNLGENNADPGGGILYCLRYDGGRIKAHQESVVSAVQSMGVQLEEVDEGIAVVPQWHLDHSESDRLVVLLEELSCLNEAQEYVDAGYGQFNNLMELNHGFFTRYFSLLNEGNLAEAYDLVTMGIPQIVSGISIADIQNGVLSSHERKALDELISFSERGAEWLDRGYVITGMG